MGIGGVTWGFAIACVTTLLLAMPLHWVVRRTFGLNFATTVLGGGGIGLALSAVFWLVAGEWSVLFSPMHGILIGVVTSTLWWNLAGKPGDNPRPAS